jgi:Limiting CO2-inducible proteins B/C beta carbonyic anhydrases
MAEVFPGAVSNSELVYRLRRSLGARGFRRDTTFLATSLCCDELSRELEEDLSRAFGGSLYFRLGGLAGFPSAGVTGFGAMSEHIPDEGGTCLIVYGPHCGVDGLGRVGTVPRKGKVDGGPCCGSAAAAADYVLRNSHPPIAADPLDIQQASVVSHLLPFAERVRSAPVPMEEVPYCLFESQDTLMRQVVSRGRSRAKNTVPLALLGGIAINTPPSEPDFFVPLRLDLYSSSIDREPEDLLSELEIRHGLWP